jgi:beta-galactosidase/beta-glucuronidase
LPLLKSLGFNTLRIYAWSNTIDHTPFLDACHAFGLKVMVTHYVGTAEENPISTTEERQAVVDAFVAHVRLLGDHPAILMWSFGNERM